MAELPMSRFDDNYDELKISFNKVIDNIDNKGFDKDDLDDFEEKFKSVFLGNHHINPEVIRRIKNLFHLQEEEIIAGGDMPDSDDLMLAMSEDGIITTQSGFDTGIDDVGDPVLPDDDGFGCPGNGSFNTPPVIEASSKTYKYDNEPANNVLEAVKKLPIEKWRYRSDIKETQGLDNKKHLGPYAEDFKQLFGVGDGVTINVLDALGVALAAIKELSAKVDELETQISS